MGTSVFTHAHFKYNPSFLIRISNSIQTLFWGLFGIIDLSEFEIVGADSTPAETIVGTFMLAIWMVSAVIAMLNLLIALISSSFERVQVGAVEFQET